MSILLDIALGVASGLAAFVLALIVLLGKLTRFLEVEDARDRDLFIASLQRWHEERTK